MGETHSIGESWGGGIVIAVTHNGEHGLIAETQDQGTAEWYHWHKLINNPANHSEAGKAFTDWRLPNKDELNEMFLQRDHVTAVSKKGSFSSLFGSTQKTSWLESYWSSTEGNDDDAWFQKFGQGPIPQVDYRAQYQLGYQGREGMGRKHGIRAVRDF